MKRKALLGEFTAKAVLSDGQLAASQEEEKTKSGSTTAATLSLQTTTTLFPQSELGGEKFWPRNAKILHDLLKCD